MKEDSVTITEQERMGFQIRLEGEKKKVEASGAEHALEDMIRA